YVGTSSCTADGTSTCTQPVYNSTLNRIELTAIISPDFGAPPNTPASALNHEVLIQFDTRITASGAVVIEIQANANWDEDNDGVNGQETVVTNDPTTTDVDDPTGLRTAFAIPTLGTWALFVLTLLSIRLAMPALRRRRPIA